MSFDLIDIIIIAGYFALTFAVGFFFSKSNNNTTEYFLAGKHIGWIVMGASLFATNVSSEHVIGLSGTAYGSVFGALNFELIGSLSCIILAWFFGSYYINSGVFTMPEFIERRYNSFCRLFLSGLSIVAYMLTKISVMLLAGGMFLEKVADIDIYTSSIILIVATGIYTVSGGLTSVAYTAAVQGIIMILGGLIMTFFCVNEAGGWMVIHERFISLDHTLLKPMDDPGLPWTGVIFGIPIITIWYHCTDQFMVHKFLSSKTLQHGQAGSILSAYLKLFPILLYIVPGIVARMLYAHGSPDNAYPTLLLNLLGPGFRGLVIVSFLAALMSSLSSSFASCSALFTWDVYKKIYPDANDFMIVNVGRIMTFVIVIVTFLWVIFIKSLSREIYLYLQVISAYIAPPVTAIFIMGIFWTRANARAASYALVCGFVLGFLKFITEILVNKNNITSGILYAFAKLNFLHFAIILFGICVGIIVIISLLTEIPGMEKLEGLTYKYASSGNAHIQQVFTPNKKIKYFNILASLVFVGIVIGIYWYTSQPVIRKIKPVNGTVLKEAEHPDSIQQGIIYMYYKGAFGVLPYFDIIKPDEVGIQSKYDLLSREDNDFFAFNFIGYIDIPADGVYTFSTSSDDGSRLYIGKDLVVDNDGLHSYLKEEGSIGLKAGKHVIRVEFFERAGEHELAVTYEGPGIPERDIPPAALYYSADQKNKYITKAVLKRADAVNHKVREPDHSERHYRGLQYEYYRGRFTALPYFDSLKAYKTGTCAQFELFSGVDAVHFAIRYTGFIDVPEDGIYSFSVSSDDGSKLYIGDMLVVDNDGLHMMLEQVGSIKLKKGKHAIRVEYFEGARDQKLVVTYQGPGIRKKVIPPEVLTHGN
jgi:SSS family solute:Na+ symporter